MEEIDTNIIELVDENNVTVQFEHIMTLTYEDREYVVLKPLESDDSEVDQVVILRVGTDENGEDVYLTIEDDQEEDEVYDAFLEVLDMQEEDES